METALTQEILLLQRRSSREAALGSGIRLAGDLRAAKAVRCALDFA